MGDKARSRLRRSFRRRKSSSAAIDFRNRKSNPKAIGPFAKRIAKVSVFGRGRVNRGVRKTALQGICEHPPLHSLSKLGGRRFRVIHEGLYPGDKRTTSGYRARQFSIPHERIGGAINACRYRRRPSFRIQDMGKLRCRSTQADPGTQDGPHLLLLEPQNSARADACKEDLKNR